MNHRPPCDRERNGHYFLAVSFGITLLAAPAWVLAELPNPLDADAPVTGTTYESPLADFRAFDPDEAMQSWIDANRRVDEIGGWRTYLRQANPPKKSAMKKAEPGDSKSVESKTPKPEMQQPPAVKEPTPKKAPPAQIAAIASPAKAPEPPASDTGIPALAEGGNDQRDEIKISPPSLPDRFSRGECPRVLTGLRLPVNPRVIALSKRTEQLLLRITKCFKSRSYVVGGHTDGRGPLGANQNLSQSRADAVRTFLVANGVNPKRVISRGFGETRPIDTNRTKRGRARNRRIDFTLDR